MRLVLVAVGRLRPALRDVCDDYLRRLGRFVPITEREVREAGRVADARARRSVESERLLDSLSPGQRVVLLDPAGECWSSEELAQSLDGWRLDGHDRALVIGGASGVSPEVQSRADARWSLGRLTYPHELARVIVVEQLYRASTILLGQPYHRGSA